MKHFGAILSCQQFSRNLFIMHGEQRLDSSVFLKYFFQILTLRNIFFLQIMYLYSANRLSM